MGEMGGWAEKTKTRIQGEIWGKWGATYERNGWVGGKNKDKNTR